LDALKDLFHGLESWLHDLLDWVEAFAGTPYGDWALFAIAFAESSLFPVPPDVLLIALCLGDPSRSLWFAALCSLGSVVGGIVGYGIGYYGGRPLLYRFFPDKKVDAVAAYFDKYNAWAIGIAGLTPLPYKLFTLSGGACAINFRVFVIVSVISRSFRFFLIAGLIWLYGEPIKAFIDQYLGLLTIAFVVILVGGCWLVSRLGRGAASEEAQEAGSRQGDDASGEGGA
jgi:membrane protein YqaA with SNARE-associated domain